MSFHDLRSFLASPEPGARYRALPSVGAAEAAMLFADTKQSIAACAAPTVAMAPAGKRSSRSAASAS